MKHYTHLIFDADHTLLDYVADELAAFRVVYNQIGLPISDELLHFSRHASESEWTNAGLYDVYKPAIQAAYHRLYRTHVTGIFEKAFEKFSVHADAEKAGKAFLAALCAPAHLYEGVETLLRKLSKNSGGRYEIIIATNGVCDIQNGRLTPIKPYISQLVVSEEVGEIKPTLAFFDALLKKTGAKKETSLMIGDSLASDVAGALRAGIDVCWYNPQGKNNETDWKPNFEISSLQDLQKYLL